MKQLFAPWRMEFVEGHKESKECVLCSLAQSKPSKESLVVYQGELAFVVMNKYPYSNGHLMVIPKRHLAKWGDLKSEELLELGLLTQKAVSVLERTFSAQGFNLGVNLGKAAGAGIADHVHQHIVPRWSGDYNFMPLFAEVKVISEHLEATYGRIVEAWK